MAFIPDKDSMYDIIHYAKEKEKDFTNLMLISKGVGDHFFDLSVKELSELQKEWKEKIKKFFSADVEAYAINSGSILCMIHTEQLDDLLEKLQTITCYNQQKDGGLICRSFILTEEEMDFITSLLKRPRP